MELYGLLATLFAMTCAGLATLGLGGIIDDRLDILNHLQPLYLAGGAGALLLQIPVPAPRNRLALACASLAVAVSALLIGPELATRWTQRSARAGGQTLKVVQMNSWGENKTPRATAAWLIGQNADVVVLEEILPPTTVQIPALVAQTYPYRTPMRAPFDCSTFILSKTRPAAWGAWPSYDTVGRHSGVWARFGHGPSAYTVVGVHNLWPFPAGRQQAQTGLLASRLDAFDRAGLILTGDFNSTPWSFSLRRQDALLGLERRSRALFTFPVQLYSHYKLWTPLPLLAIDHIYAGSSWRTVSVMRGPNLGSSHLPVVAVLTR